MIYVGKSFVRKTKFIATWVYTRPEGESFTHQGLCYLKKKALQFRVCGFLKKLYSQGKSQTSVYFINREYQGNVLYSRVMCVILSRSKVARSIHVAIRYIEHVMLCKRKNRFGSRWESL